MTGKLTEFIITGLSSSSASAAGAPWPSMEPQIHSENKAPLDIQTQAIKAPNKPTASDHPESNPSRLESTQILQDEDASISLTTNSYAFSETTASQSTGLITGGASQSPTMSWSSLDPSYPGLYRSSYQTYGLGGNKFTVNTVRIDLTTPGIKLATTTRISSNWQDEVQETQTKKVSQFIASSQATNKKIVVAINTDAFSLTNANQSVATTLRGFAVSDGILVSSGTVGGNGATLFWDSITGPRMELTSKTSPNTSNIAAGTIAISGFSFALINGIAQPSDTSLNARSGVGLSADGQQLFMLTIDKKSGKNRSDGATIQELGEQLSLAGAYTGIHLDGGGSTQMAYWNPTTASPQLLGGVDSRYVGQHLGIYYE